MLFKIWIDIYFNIVHYPKRTYYFDLHFGYIYIAFLHLYILKVNLSSYIKLLTLGFVQIRQGFFILFNNLLILIA